MLSGSDDTRLRRKKAVLVGVLAVIVLASLCMTSSQPPVVSPLEVFEIYAVYLQGLWCDLFDPANAPVIAEVLARHPTYYWTLSSFSSTAAFVLGGFMLGVSGALYQNVFRNPIAAPSMLGVSSGIQLAVAVIVALFGTLAGEMVVARYALSYGVVAVIIVVLFALAWLMTGKGRALNVTNLLLVGVIINQFVGVIVLFITSGFDEERYDIYESLIHMSNFATDPLTWAILIGGFAISLVPVLVLKFRLNALAFSPAEARMFGVDVTRLQVLALVCGTVAMVTAQLNVGLVAMITLVVPHLSRAWFGAEFRKQLSGTLLLGAIVLLVCKMISSALVVVVTDLFPLNVVVNLVLLPAFVWMIATQQRRWD